MRIRFGSILVGLAATLVAGVLVIEACEDWVYESRESLLVMWCMDDDGRIVHLQPDLVRRGRIVRAPFGWLPR